MDGAAKATIILANATGNFGEIVYAFKDNFYSRRSSSHDV